MDGKQILKNIIDNASDSLSFGPKNVVGIDIGSTSVKVAEVEKRKDGSFKLLKYASEPLPEAAIIEDEIQKEEEVIEAISSALKKSSINLKFACLGLSGSNVVAKKLQLAGGDEEEIDDQVAWEAEQYLPFAIDECKMSYYVVGENSGGGVDVIIAAAREDVVENYKNIVERTDKLRVKIVDISSLAKINLFELAFLDRIEDPSQSWIILDVGAQKSELTIYRNDTIAFSRELPIGGSVITEEIQRQLGVNYQEAEDLKIVGDQNGNLPEEIVEIVEQVIEVFFTEMKKTIDFYVSSTSDENFAGCVLTGGGSLIPGLLEGLETLLGIEVGILNPFDAIDIDESKFSEAQLNEIAYHGVTAIGLGMREFKK